MEENTSYKKYKVQIINKNEEEDFKLILRNEDDPTESKLSIIYYYYSIAIMVLSSPKYFVSIEIEISAIVQTANCNVINVL